MLRIITTNYNNEQYIARCIKTLKKQVHGEFKCTLIDDVSTDNTLEVMRWSVGGDARFDIVSNKIRKYQIPNYLEIIDGWADDDVVICVDGDDWLPDSYVLSRIAKEYSNPSVWLTWGSFIGLGGHCYNPTWEDIGDLYFFRTRHHLCHLKTFKVHLWRRIPDHELRYKDGSYFRTASDVAMTIPMLELAGRKHARFLKEINYFYNGVQPLCNHFVMGSENIRNVKYIRSKAPRFGKFFL